jgi:hypothetical protein
VLLHGDPITLVVEQLANVVEAELRPRNTLVHNPHKPITDCD